jgi:pimeloyl-ACP methyl ester carboxylesterase
VVILLHGFPEDRRSWAGVTPALNAAGYRTLAPDQRGYSPGARPRHRREYTMEQLTGDVFALADAAGADRFHVVGHDWGASLAWHLAARHPERIRSLTALSVPHPRAILDAFWRSTQALRLYYMVFFQLPAVPEWLIGRPGVLQRSLTGSGLDEESARRYAGRAGAMTGPLNWYRALPYSVRGGKMPKVTVPTLYVWGDRDRFVTPAAAAGCGAWVTGPFTYRPLPGVSHWIAEEDPARTAELVLDLLQSRG